MATQSLRMSQETKQKTERTRQFNHLRVGGQEVHNGAHCDNDDRTSGA